MELNQLSEPPFPVDTVEPEPEIKMSAARRIAFKVWNEGCRPGIDPPAESLPPETQSRIEFFAREVRNRTIDELAGAIQKFLAKTNALAVESILKWKE